MAALRWSPLPLQPPLLRLSRFLRIPLPQRSPPNDTENDRVIRELAQLLDAYDSYISMTEKHGESESDAVVDQKELSLPKLSERFMGLRAAIFTKCPTVRSLASNLGFTVFQLAELIKKTDSRGEFIQEAYPTKRCYIFINALQALIDAEVLRLRQEQKKVTRQYNVYSI